MKYLILFISAMAINNFHKLFINYNDAIFNFVYDVGQHVLFIYIFCFIFTITPKEKFKERALCLILALIFINLLMNTIYDKLDLSLFYIQYPLGGLLCMYFSYSVSRWQSKSIVKITGSKTYFVFKRPKYFIDFIITMFQLPVNSFSIISDGKWYKFSKRSQTLYRIDFNKINQDYYHIVKVIKTDSKLLNSLVGKRWSLCKSNCVTGFKPAIESNYKKLGFFDFIPSVFAYKFSRGKYDL